MRSHSIFPIVPYDYSKGVIVPDKGDSVSIGVETFFDTRDVQNEGRRSLFVAGSELLTEFYDVTDGRTGFSEDSGGKLERALGPPDET
jgi:hypothetical protein